MWNKLRKALLELKKRTMIRTKIRLFFQNIQIEKELKKLNSSLKNTHEGQRCFILGTGPSLKNQDLSPLRNEWTFVTNGFYLHPQYDIIHPKFFSSIDSECFKEDGESKKFAEEVSKKVHADTTMILPFQYKDVIEKRGLFKKNKKIYISQDRGFEESGDFNISLDKQIPVLQNVIFSAMIPAHYMGFKTMYLMGVEHDWLARPSSTPEKPYTEDPHFYEADEFPKIPLLSTINPYEKQCYCAFIAFKTYRLLKEKMIDVKIFNLTPGSFLDVFPFKKYEDVMKSIANEKK